MKTKDFSLLDQNNQAHQLSDYLGKWVVLYFYPKDDTPGCTKEACNFRDSFHQLQNLGVQILGVSKDSVASHKKFADKYNLNFPILSDESKEVLKTYDALGFGKSRKTYLIGPDGQIRKTYPHVNPLTHASAVIKDLTELKN